MVHTGEVAVTKTSKAAMKMASDLMDDCPVEVEDITIPKLLLQQSQSAMFREGKSKIGEVRGSLEGNLVMGVGESVDFIPFSVYKTWVTLKVKGGVFVEEVPYAKASKEREETRDGEDLKNYQTLNYYCLLPSDIESGVYMPYVISFRSTSYTAGKTLETKRALLQEFGKPLCFKTFTLSAKADRNADGNDYQTFQVHEARGTSDNELKAVKDWMGIIKTKNVTIDDSDIKTEGATSEKRTRTTESDEF